MHKILALVFIGLVLVGCKDIATELKNDYDNDGKRDWIPEPDLDPVMRTANGIAYGNGLARWKDVSEIKFTFNVDRAGRHFERTWIWEPKTHNVQLISTTDTIVYNRNNLDESDLGVDREFINDKYWLLAPFHLIWDEDKKLSEKANQVAPISGDTLDMLTITYGNEGGYTPGDAYDFYFGKDYKVKEWVFRQGNDSLPSMTTTWEDYETFKGIEIAKMHTDSLGSFKLSFTNISVKK